MCSRPHTILQYKVGTMASTDPLPTPNPSPVTVNHLPAEILVEVFSYLSLHELIHAACVCNKWYELLKRQTMLWKHKEYFSRRKSEKDDIMVIVNCIPQFRCLHILHDNEFGIHIAYPEAAVSFFYDERSRVLQKVPVPYFVEFNTKHLVVSVAVFQVCLKWVRCETLETIHIADQCAGAGTNPASPFYYYGDGSHCYGPICSYKGLQPIFCALCTYSHHFNCIGKLCPLNSYAEERVNLWCHQDKRHSPKRLNPNSVSSQHWCYRSEKCHVSLETQVDAVLGKQMQCPSLREATVSSASLTPMDLRFLCTISPLRVLRIESASVRNLSFLRHCRTTLEELTIADGTWVPPESYKELRYLERLKLLRLSKYRVANSTIKKYTKHLRHLECILQKPLEPSAATSH